MTLAWSWPAVAALVSGLTSLYFIRYLWPYRDRPGARFFIATIASEALWALSYGAALFVFDPALRPLFELPIWIGVNFIGVFFLAFALEYTGRGHLVRSKSMGLVVLVQVVHTLVVATNPLHGIAWSGYQLEPVFGAATVTYVHQPWLFVNFAGIFLMVAAGSFLLFDTFFSYGRLYRAQAVAIALSPVLPGLTFLLWLFEFGVTPPLNLAPLTFPVHLGFDMFAFFRRNMFELTPAARRVGERAAIDDLGSPVIIVDDDGRVINANDAARTLFPEGERAVLGRQLDALIDGIDLAADDQTVSITAGTERREYAVATSALADAAGTHLGSTVVLQDITAEKQREQRLTVLNRVLRHNLRNDLNVVQGNLELASRRATDDEVLEVVANARAKTAEVAALGEKARLIERTLDADDRADRPVALASVLADVRRDLLADRDGGQIDVRVPEDCTLRTDPGLLEGVVRNLVENGLDHADASDPAVEVVLTSVDDDGWATLEIRDEGPGLPDHERRVIETGEETDLVHGSGLGLWYVTWAVDALGGHLRFDTGDGGTTVTLRLPGVVDADR